VLKGLLVVVILTLPALAQDQHPARTSAGCGLATIAFDVKGDKGPHSITPPDAGKAAVYVIQWEKLDVDTFHIGAVTTRVGLDGSWQGANRGDSFLLFSVDPGEHHICVDWQSSLRELAKAGSAVTLTSEAEKPIISARPSIHDKSTLRPWCLRPLIPPKVNC